MSAFEQRIFGAGLREAILPSLAAALQTLDISVRRFPTLPQDVDRFEAVLGIDCLTHWHDWSERFPNACFIHVGMEQPDWLAAVQAMLAEPLVFKTEQTQRETVYGSLAFDEEHWVRFFETTQTRIEQLAKALPHRVLILNENWCQQADPWQPICDFLGREHPQIPFPVIDEQAALQHVLGQWLGEACPASEWETQLEALGFVITDETRSWLKANDKAERPEMGKVDSCERVEQVLQAIRATSPLPPLQTEKFCQQVQAGFPVGVQVDSTSVIDLDFGDPVVTHGNPWSKLDSENTSLQQAPWICHPNREQDQPFTVRHPIESMESGFDTLALQAIKVDEGSAAVSWQVRLDWEGDLEEKQTVLDAGNPRGSLRFDMRQDQSLTAIEQSVSLVDPTHRFDRTAVKVIDVALFKTNPLVDLQDRYRTDKGSQVNWGGKSGHFYGLIYHQWLQQRRDTIQSIVEIGLDQASARVPSVPRDVPSVRAWLDYFPQAQVIGADIRDFSHLPIPRFHFVRVDQGSMISLARVASTVSERQRGADLIIDDGSHASAHQVLTLEQLFGLLNPQGVYIIEDIQWQPGGIAHTVSVKQMLTQFQRSRRLQHPLLSASFCRQFEQRVNNVLLWSARNGETAIIQTS